MNNKKRIIMIAYYYWPDNSIGAVRPTKIIKYLSSEYSIDVLTRKREGFLSYEDQYAEKIIEVDNVHSKLSDIISLFRNTTIYKLFRNRDLKKNGKKEPDFHEKQTRISYFEKTLTKHEKNGNDKASLAGIASTKLLLVQSFLDDIRYGKEAIKIIRQAGTMEEYEYIISECAPFSSNIVAYYFKKKMPNVIWIADFRDPVIQADTPAILRLYYSFWMKRVEKKAKHVVTVNEIVLDELKLKTSKGKIISNGYDREDYIEIVKDSDKETRKRVVFTYTGNVYPRKRNLLLFFRALKELNEDNDIDLNNIVVKYAGSDYVSMVRQAEVYGIQYILEDNGSINHEDAIKLQRESDVLLLATWNTEKEQGVITGKFFEYLAAEKPIISLVTGNKPNSLIKEYTDNYDLGCCVEYVNADRDYFFLKQYIREIYEQYINKGRIYFTTNKEFVNSFSYDELICKWKEIID